MYANFNACTIVLTKTESTKAGNPATEEFQQLVALRNAFPQFAVVVKAARGNSRDNYKGLDYKFMEKYIEDHDGEDADANKATLCSMQGKNADGSGNPLLRVCSYGEIKMWFLETHPEIESMNSKTREELESIKRTRAERRAA